MAASYSSLATYEQCPKKYHFKYVLREKEPQSEFAARGDVAHNTLERAIKDHKPAPQELEWTGVNNLPYSAKAEETWYFNEQWGLTEREGAWLVIKTDAWVPSLSLIIDWKTGKREGNELKHMRQMQLYATGGYVVQGQAIDTRLTYLDHNINITRHWTLGQLKNAKETFTRQINEMNNDTTFKPKPSKLCNWCGYNNRCEYAYEG